MISELNEKPQLENETNKSDGPKKLKTSNFETVLFKELDNTPKGQDLRIKIQEIFMSVYSDASVPLTPEGFIHAGLVRVDKFYAKDPELASIIRRVFPLLFE